MKPAVCDLRTIFRILIGVTSDIGYVNIPYSVHEHTYTEFLNIDTACILIVLNLNLMDSSDIDHFIKPYRDPVPF